MHLIIRMGAAVSLIGLGACEHLGQSAAPSAPNTLRIDPADQGIDLLDPSEPVEEIERVIVQVDEAEAIIEYSDDAEIILESVPEAESIIDIDVEPEDAAAPSGY